MVVQDPVIEVILSSASQPLASHFATHSMPILQPEPHRYPEQVLSLAGDGPSEMADADQPSRRWWAFCTKARQEKAVARELLQREIPFYLPLHRKENLIRGKRVPSQIPLFSGYIFTWVDESERSQVYSTNRVWRAIPVDDQQRLTQDLRGVQLSIESDQPLSVESRIQAGERVRVKSGPMAGVEGIVLERRGRVRLLIKVHFLQQGVSLEIDDLLVEPIG